MLADKLEPFPIRQSLTALVHPVASMVAFIGSMVEEHWRAFSGARDSDSESLCVAYGRLAIRKKYRGKSYGGRIYVGMIYHANGVVLKKKRLISSGEYCSCPIHHLTVSAKSQTI